jgi:hypothetical protein
VNALRGFFAGPRLQHRAPTGFAVVSARISTIAVARPDLLI